MALWCKWLETQGDYLGVQVITQLSHTSFLTANTNYSLPHALPYRETVTCMHTNLHIHTADQQLLHHLDLTVFDFRPEWFRMCDPVILLGFSLIPWVFPKMQHPLSMVNRESLNNYLKALLYLLG